jgi:hypothetical protein
VDFKRVVSLFKIISCSGLIMIRSAQSSIFSILNSVNHQYLPWKQALATDSWEIAHAFLFKYQKMKAKTLSNLSQQTKKSTLPGSRPSFVS